MEAGAAVRLRFFEHYKQRVINGKYIDVRGPVNHIRTTAGNAAAHRGNFRADYALNLLHHLKETGEDATLFGKQYGVIGSQTPIPQFRDIYHYTASAKISETLDLCATLRSLHRHKPACVTDEVAEEFTRQVTSCTATFRLFVNEEMGKSPKPLPENGILDLYLQPVIKAANKFNEKGHEFSNSAKYDFFERVEYMGRIVRAAEEKAAKTPLQGRKARRYKNRSRAEDDE